jgi:beta-aspartyl-peptidase (threonine type)
MESGQPVNDRCTAISDITPFLRSRPMTSNAEKPIAIIVHGGAGDIPDERRARAEAGCREAAAVGWEMLAAGASALDAVEAAVRAMEDHPAFNAGRGSVLNAAGVVEMDAGIMDGATRLPGAVTLVRHIEHPISLARKVMEKTPHHILGGEGAEAFAREMGFVLVSNDFFITERRLEQYQKRLQAETADTVGAVALDARGNLAAANSTGGVNFKMPGRVGDSPLPGAGFYADNRFGAVATTGQGEHILRAGLSFLVMRLLEAGLPAQEAAAQARTLFDDHVPGGRAGWIALDAAGRVGIFHTTRNLSYAWRTAGVDDFISGLEM